MNSQRLGTKEGNGLKIMRKRLIKTNNVLINKINEAEELQKASLDKIIHQAKLKKEELTIKNQKLVKEGDKIKIRSTILQNEIKKFQNKHSECMKERQNMKNKSSKIEGMSDIHKLSIENLKNTVDHSLRTQKQVAEAINC